MPARVPGLGSSPPPSTSSIPYGRGLPHQATETILPPTLSFFSSVTHFFTSLVTVEPLVGNLDQLQRDQR
jgi:hypothetical protein